MIRIKKFEADERTTEKILDIAPLVVVRIGCVDTHFSDRYHDTNC